ncbi:hypothetical protein BGZ60DRAFT_189741 [Tricladium varicosporioides]|nr:hypothetical protein BGZ60DRAFT_189741 [Hymenoscyphus varicosporioides]
MSNQPGEVWPSKCPCSVLRCAKDSAVATLNAGGNPRDAVGVWAATGIWEGKVLRFLLCSTVAMLNVGRPSAHRSCVLQPMRPLAAGDLPQFLMPEQRGVWRGKKSREIATRGLGHRMICVAKAICGQHCPRAVAGDLAQEQSEAIQILNELRQRKLPGAVTEVCKTVLHESDQAQESRHGPNIDAALHPGFLTFCFR